MIDSHCHFDLPAFDNKREKILKNAYTLGVEKLLVPGLTLTQFSQLIDLKRSHVSIDIALGCHPYFLTLLTDNELARKTLLMADLASQHCALIVAVGECGIDGSLKIPMAFQEKVLTQHIRIAKAFNKPLILHHRQSHNALIRILKQEKFDGGGVVHAFSGSYQIAQTYIDMGLSLGVGGTITYDRAIKTRNTIKAVGMEHILLETDAPDMPLFGFQGMPNTPERLPLIASALAQLKGISLNEVEQCTTANYKRIFSLEAK
jgi:TatD DNase family protein